MLLVAKSNLCRTHDIIECELRNSHNQLQTFVFGGHSGQADKQTGRRCTESCIGKINK